MSMNRITEIEIQIAWLRYMTFMSFNQPSVTHFNSDFELVNTSEPIKIANAFELKFASLQTMEALVAPIPLESQKLSLGDNNGTENVKRPAPLTGGCRIEGYVRVKKVTFQQKLNLIKHWTCLLSVVSKFYCMEVFSKLGLRFFTCFYE